MSSDDDILEYYTTRLSPEDDFMGMEIPPVFRGRLAGMARHCRNILAKFDSAGVFKILDSGDAMLEMYIANGLQVQHMGQSVSLTRDVLNEMDPLSLVSIVAFEISLMSSKSPTNERPAISYEEFCVAVALAHIVWAIMYPSTEWLLGEGGCHAMLAGDAVMLGAMERVVDTWAKQKLSERGSNAAHASHARRAARIAKPKVFHEWEQWQAGKMIYKSGADFANKMIAQFDPAIRNPKTIEKWCAEWREKRRRNIETAALPAPPES
jgi:hypothetical protein